MARDPEDAASTMLELGELWSLVLKKATHSWLISLASSSSCSMRAKPCRRGGADVSARGRHRNSHIDALSTTLTAFGRHVRYASEQAPELKDADTADIFTQIARGIDTWLWFVETSWQTGS